MHAVHKLYQYRKSISTKPFAARGNKVNRCELCRLAIKNCICSLTPKVESQVGFLLLMYDAEVLKPSNTGKLIADVCDNTFAFLWSRTGVDPQLLAILNDKQWLPIIVFPQQYASEQQTVYLNTLPEVSQSNQRPLFILLDGSWREAKKMFRKSPYLANLPVCSFELDSISQAKISHYIRDAEVANQLSTAQVAAQMLAFAGETANGELLSRWFDLFNYQYQKSVCQPNKGRSDALMRFSEYVSEMTKNNN